MSANIDRETRYRLWRDLFYNTTTRAFAPPSPDVRARVASGIALLDDHGPQNWRSRINPDTINIRDVRHCTLGQVYGHYDDGIRHLQLWGSGYQYGFSTSDEDPSSTWAELNVAWREALAA